MAADGRGLVGHAGAVLLRVCADRTGLAGALSLAPGRGGVPPLWDRGLVLVHLAVAIALGATSVSDIALLAHHGALFGAPPSQATVRRTLRPFDPVLLARIAKARARVRAHVWDLIAATGRGFPWLVVAGKVLTGWVVIDLDATIIESSSPTAGAAGTFKKSFGHHRLAGWCANTQECLAMLLREGSAGSNTVADHLEVLAACIAQIPAAYRAKLLIRVDGAGASHGLLERIEALGTTRRTVRYTVGWTITEADEDAIAALPQEAWEAAVDRDADVHSACHVAELTGLDARVGNWPKGTRLIVRRARPSRRHLGNLTDLEKRTGWRYQIVATNITRMRAVPGSQHPRFLDVPHRNHAVVEDRVRGAKATGLRNLPSKAWSVNPGWMLAANLAADLDAWTRLLGLHDDEGLVRAEPATMRYRIYHLPAKLTRHARCRRLHLPDTWPWREAFLTCWRRLISLPAPG